MGHFFILTLGKVGELTFKKVMCFRGNSIEIVGSPQSFGKLGGKLGPPFKILTGLSPQKGGVGASQSNPGKFLRASS